MDNPTPEELVAKLIEAAEKAGGKAWWDGEFINIDFGGARVQATVNVGRENLRDLVDKGLGPL